MFIRYITNAYHSYTWIQVKHSAHPEEYKQITHIPYMHIPCTPSMDILLVHKRRVHAFKHACTLAMHAPCDCVYICKRCMQRISNIRIRTLVYVCGLSDAETFASTSDPVSETSKPWCAADRPHRRAARVTRHRAPLPLRQSR
jgi:hypothetical protein